MTLAVPILLISFFYSLLIKKTLYVIGISIIDTDTFSDVRVRPPVLVGLPIPIRVNGILLVFGKIHWGVDTDT